MSIYIDMEIFILCFQMTKGIFCFISFCKMLFLQKWNHVIKLYVMKIFDDLKLLSAKHPVKLWFLSSFFSLAIFNMECPLSYTQAHKKAISWKIWFLTRKRSTVFNCFTFYCKILKDFSTHPWLVNMYLKDTILNKFSFH